MSETRGPRPTLRRAMRWAGIAIAGAVFLGAAASAGLWWAMRPVGLADAPVRTVIIAPGESTRQIARRLADAGLVRSPWVVIAAAKRLGATSRLQHGEYALRPTQSAWEIVGAIARGENVQHRVTIPEGYTVTQIADALATAGLVDRDRFLALALHGGRRVTRATLEALPVDSLEGYLFPDTYVLPRGLGEIAVLNRFLERFDAGVRPDIHAAARGLGLTLHQLLTVASMIERETRVPQERPVIASVIYNRLRRGMRLEIDATVLYALGRHKSVVTERDLAVESPYNTYRHHGLPPGPISNPGLASIRAAATPADAPYLYYVLRPDGGHHFSRTLREHAEAIRRYRP
ncbi:MAG: endolytic transglycosylase MltG [Armatimonadota bacterium]